MNIERRRRNALNKKTSVFPFHVRRSTLDVQRSDCFFLMIASMDSVSLWCKENELL
jgi:hypothetical protein